MDTGTSLTFGETLLDWVLAVLIIGTLLGYLSITGPRRKRYEQSESVPLARRVWFCLGIVLIFAALLSPMTLFGDNYMFSVHMIQHLILVLLVPPLLLVGIPPWLFRLAFRYPGVERVVSIVTWPIVAALLLNVNLWLWHAPGIFLGMMSNPYLHTLANILYLVTGLFFWWPLLNPLLAEGQGLSLGGKLAYIFFSDMPMMLLGAGMTFMQPLYTMRMGTSLHRISAADQQLGGLLMWVGGGLFFYIIMTSIIFLRWMFQQERKDQESALLYEVEDEEVRAATKHVEYPSPSQQTS
jgi:putative membrane protein